VQQLESSAGSGVGGMAKVDARMAGPAVGLGSAVDVTQDSEKEKENQKATEYESVATLANGEDAEYIAATPVDLVAALHLQQRQTENKNPGSTSPKRSTPHRSKIPKPTSSSPAASLGKPLPSRLTPVPSLLSPAITTTSATTQTVAGTSAPPSPTREQQQSGISLGPVGTSVSLGDPERGN